jgi:tetratricopeptide (TPR) repeat protein
VLRRCAEAFGNDPGLLVDIAQRLYKAKLLREAAEFGVKAMEKFGADPKGYSIAVRAFMAMREYEQAEKVFRAVLRRFGAHPRTYQSMAKMYLDWRKFDDAYDYAKQALEADPTLKDAKAIMEKVGDRIFSKTSSSEGFI